MMMMKNKKKKNKEKKTKEEDEEGMKRMCSLLASVGPKKATLHAD